MSEDTPQSPARLMFGAVFFPVISVGMAVGAVIGHKSGTIASIARGSSETYLEGSAQFDIDLFGYIMLSTVFAALSAACIFQLVALRKSRAMHAQKEKSP